MARTGKADGPTTKGHNSVKSVGGVIFLVLCTLSDDVLYLYKVSRKYLKPFPSYGPDTKKLTDGQTDRWTDRRTDELRTTRPKDNSPQDNSPHKKLAPRQLAPPSDDNSPHI